MTRNKEIPAAEKTALWEKWFGSTAPKSPDGWPRGADAPAPFPEAIQVHRPGWAGYSELRVAALGAQACHVPEIQAVRQACESIQFGAVCPEEAARAEVVRDWWRRTADPWWAYADKTSLLRWVWCAVEPFSRPHEHTYLILELFPDDSLSRYALWSSPGYHCRPYAVFPRHGDESSAKVVHHAWMDACAEVDGMTQRGDFFVCQWGLRNDFFQARLRSNGRFRVEWQVYHPMWQVGCDGLSRGELKRLMSLYWRLGIPGIEGEAPWRPLAPQDWGNMAPSPPPAPAAPRPDAAPTSTDMESLLARCEKMDKEEEERLKARWLDINPSEIWKMTDEEVVKTAVMLNRNPDLRAYDIQFTFHSVREVREGLWWETA